MFVRWTHSVVFIKRSRRFAILIGIDHKTQRVRWLLADVIHLWSHRNDCPGPNKHWHTLKGSFYANHRAPLHPLSRPLSFPAPLPNLTHPPPSPPPTPLPTP